MKGTKVAIFLAIALISFAACHDFPEEEGVLVLGEDNFDDALKHYEHVLVEVSYIPYIFIQFTNYTIKNLKYLHVF
jgi:hypothetical protein